jgi:hypothetical protein
MLKVKSRRIWSRLAQMLILAAITIPNFGAAATVGVFTGGDPGEGLDLQGNFVYAVDVGPSGAGGRVGDANFTADDVAGVTITTTHNIAPPGWVDPTYGETENDLNLAVVISSIRWSQAPAEVVTTLAVVPGTEYKLQLLFGEDCCAGRGFNVIIDGATEVTNLMPARIQMGDTDDLMAVKDFVGVVVTKTFVATGNELSIILSGPAADLEEINDRNAILNGLTLERVGAAGDADADGLPDVWEQLYFQGLAQTATGDPDADGLTNTAEFTGGTDPSKADTDGDTLTDGAELNTHNTDPKKADTDNDGLNDQAEVVTHRTDPLKADSDGDRLSDGSEVNVSRTDPAKADTDGDGVNDFDELRVLTDPTVATSVSKTTTVGAITGGDLGEGVDLQGNFIYAFSIGTENPAGQVGDANFTGETVSGVTIERATSVIENWWRGVFGETPNDVGLAAAISSIRHGGGGARIFLENLVPGATYKLQLMFAEWCCARGMDIQFNGRQIVDEFAPYIYMGGFSPTSLATNHAAIVTYSFVANTNSAEIVTVGGTVTTPAYTDRNPIINAVTLEQVLPPTDTDNDGLQDEWERINFGNLDRTGTADTDADGLTNTREFALDTVPTNADTDGDGLNDGQEANTTNTNPASRDTDSDGISDGDEINIHRTNPIVADSDADGLPDGLEIITGGAVTKVTNVVVQAFSGGDPGEGLDLQGNFRYAVNVSSAGAAGKAGDADFTADTAPGVRIIAPSNIPAWDMPEYGDTPADTVIEKVTQSIRYGPTVQVLLTNLVPASTYRLQMLFFEQCCVGRGFNIYADGELVAADFSPPEIQGGVNNTAAGAVVSADIETQRDNMVILLTTFGRTREDLTDPNAILDGFTLEVLKEGPVVTRPTLTLTKNAAGTLTITTGGTLQVADAVTGPYTSLPDKTITVDPKTATAGKQKFYRATQ